MRGESEGAGRGKARAEVGDGMDEGQGPTGRPTSFIVLAVKRRFLKVRREDDGRVAVLHPADGVVGYVPGEIVVVRPGRVWTFGRTLHLTGELVRRHLDARRLGLAPLRLFERGMWEPGEGVAPDELDAELEQHPELAAVYRAGPRPAYEMEQVVPGAHDGDPWDDPIDQAVQASEVGDFQRAADILGACLEADLRCLDAHAHLGKLAFDSGFSMVAAALRHYRVGVAIGDLSLGESFAGVLPWGYLDNRPYLRCLHGLGLAWWRLGEPKRAQDVFRRLLWLDPEDRVGARFCLADIRRGLTWEQACIVEEAVEAARAGATLGRACPGTEAEP